MNKVLLLLVSMFTVFGVFAEDSPEQYRVRLTKADGTVFEAYNNTSFRNWFKPKVSSISVSEKFKGTATKYTGEEVKRLVFVESLLDSIPVIFDAVKAQSKLPSLFSKNPKPYKEPIFLRLVYNGENVKGYAMPIMNSTYTPSLTKVQYTWRYFYLTKDSDVAVAYWDDVDDIIPGMKKTMKFYLREFPELVEMVDNEEITPRMFRDNPTIVLPIIDRIYKPKE